LSAPRALSSTRPWTRAPLQARARRRAGTRTSGEPPLSAGPVCARQFGGSPASVVDAGPSAVRVRMATACRPTRATLPFSQRYAPRCLRSRRAWFSYNGRRKCVSWQVPVPTLGGDGAGGSVDRQAGRQAGRQTDRQFVCMHACMHSIIRQRAEAVAARDERGSAAGARLSPPKRGTASSVYRVHNVRRKRTLARTHASGQAGWGGDALLDQLAEAFALTRRSRTQPSGKLIYLVHPLSREVLCCIPRLRGVHASRVRAGAAAASLPSPPSAEALTRSRGSR